MHTDKREMLDAWERSHRRPCLWGLAGAFPKPAGRDACRYTLLHSIRAHP
jgi:hypothetical protein